MPQCRVLLCLMCLGLVRSATDPPAPAPGVCPPYTVYPAPGCNCAYNKSKCASLTDAGGCEWCSSVNGNHNLCFASSGATKLDKSLWTCGSGSVDRNTTISPSAPTNTPKAAAPQHWAVIVAGSKVYSNYRHQSDVCHAYSIVLKNGIPKENIILMMQDDIANDPQ